MFVLFIAMVLALYLHGQYAPDAPDTDGMLLMLLVLPRLAVGLLYWLLCKVTLRRLTRGHGRWAMRWIHRLTRFYMFAVLVLFLSDLHNGLLVRLHQLLGGNPLLIDDLIVLLPSLLLILWCWWCYYPIDNRLRQASLMRQLDAGLPPPVLSTRSQYVIAQFRHQVAIVLLPLLLLRAWGEAVGLLPSMTWLGWSVNPVLALAGALGVMMFAPVMLRHLWDTQPLPQGELRSSLETMCAQHRVKVSELLLWRTYGSMINAAVMGLVAPVRYILLTDALLDQVPSRQVEAVMAHEIGHVRRRHLIWLIGTAGALLIALEWLWRLVLDAHFMQEAIGLLVDVTRFNMAAHFDNVTMLLALVSWFFAFGWVSRRFERQADTFAVQHLSQRYSRSTDPQDPAKGMVVDAQAASTMIEALQKIAELNHIAVRRNSWRHGSIHWRQRYIQSLVGQPLHRLAIDTQMRLIKLMALVVIIAVAGLEML